MHSYHNVAELRQIRGAGAHADSNRLYYGPNERVNVQFTVSQDLYQAPER
jgi:hypothetical protein